MIFSSDKAFEPSKTALQKKLDSEKTETAPPPPANVWSTDPIEGCDDPKCSGFLGPTAQSLRLGFPDPVYRGGEA